MASSVNQGLRIAGIACAVPERVSSAADLARIFGETEAQKIAKSTGVAERRVTKSLCTSDLCCASAEKLLGELGWEPGSIDCLVFVTQTPDYVVPATSCVLQARLGLGKNCAAFDVNLGCSGYVYGLWIVSRLLQEGQRALLLVGDTGSRLLSPEDRSVVPLFGDAGSATAVEKDASKGGEICFSVGTDGTGSQNIIVPAGSFRTPSTEKTRERCPQPDGALRSDEDLVMNGPEVFSFTLREVPRLLESALALASWSMGDVDAFVFHQANRFMLEHLAKKMGIPAEKLVLALKDFGNTSSASIPLAIASSLRENVAGGSLKLVLAGFGVGWSWGACTLTLGPIVLPEIIEVPEPVEGSASL